MKWAVVLGPLNAIAVWQLVALEVDHIYYFSAQESLLPKLPIACSRLDNPQLNVLQESVIVERCIERNIEHISDSACDNALMRRALRLSELRVEARCYLNIIDHIQKQHKFNAENLESLIVVSHYLVAADIPPSSCVNIIWLHVYHKRLLGLIPGVGRLFLFCRLISSRKFGWSRGR